MDDDTELERTIPIVVRQPTLQDEVTSWAQVMCWVVVSLCIVTLIVSATLRVVTLMWQS